MFRLGAIVLACAALQACAVTVPVAVIGSRGEVLKGASTTRLTEGTFQASNATLSCSGTYDPQAGGRHVSVAVKCSDGRAGVGTAFRDTGSSGSGVINMNDGSKATFIFGSGAAALQ